MTDTDTDTNTDTAPRTQHRTIAVPPAPSSTKVRRRERRVTLFLIIGAALDVLLFVASLTLVITNQGQGTDLTTGDTAAIFGVAGGISAATIGGVLALLQAVRSSD